MPDVALPRRKGPLKGTLAFNEDEEMLIWQAIEVDRHSKMWVALQVGVSLETIYQILKRVKKRLESAPSDQAA